MWELLGRQICKRQMISILTLSLIRIFESEYIKIDKDSYSHTGNGVS